MAGDRPGSYRHRHSDNDEDGFDQGTRPAASSA